MKVTIDTKEIGEAIVEYLARRGVNTDVNHVYLFYNGSNSFTAEARDVKMPPQEGPYR